MYNIVKEILNNCNMKKPIILSAIVIMTLISSCSRYIAPQFTSIEKILLVKPDMSVNQVSATLGIEPYNILHLNEDGDIILIYNYRLKNRIMKVSTTNRDEFNRKTRNEDSQTAGNIWYDKEPKQLYVLFDDNKVQSFISDAGKSDSEYLLITNNNIVLASEGEINSYDDQSDGIPMIFQLKRSEVTIKEKKGLFNKKDSN